LDNFFVPEYVYDKFLTSLYTLTQTIEKLNLLCSVGEWCWRKERSQKGSHPIDDSPKNTLIIVKIDLMVRQLLCLITTFALYTQPCC